MPKNYGNRYLHFFRSYPCLLLFWVCMLGYLRTASAGDASIWAVPSVSGWNNPAYIYSYNPLELARIKAMLHKGRDYIWESPDSTIAWMQDVIRQSNAMCYPDGLVEANMNLGLAAMGQGDFEKSFTFYREAEKYIPFSPKKNILLGALYINIGVTYVYQANYDQASRYCYLVLQLLIRQKAGNSNIIMAYNNLADILLKMGQYDQADYYIEQGEHLARTSNNGSVMAYLFSNKGDIATGRKNYTRADSCYKAAWHYAHQSKNQEVEQAILNSIGKMLLQQDKPSDAVPFLKRASELNLRNYPYYSSIMPRYNLGEALYKTGHYKEAEKILLAALDKATKTGIRENKLNALATLAAVYERLGQQGKALEQRKIFIGLQDSLLNKEKIQAVNQMEVKYRTAEKDKELVSKQLEIAMQKRRIGQKNLWIALIICGAVSAGLLFLAVYRSNRHLQTIAVLEAMMEGEEKERSRIARELHDGIGGMLAAVQMRLSTLQQNTGMDEVATMIKSTSAEVRKTAHNLMPDIIKRHTFLEALQLYCVTLNHASSTMQVTLQVHEPIHVRNKETELSLYRIVQELLQNVVKHAHASEVTIQVHQQNNRLNIMVEDNGMGFDTVKVSSGLGMHNIKLRVHRLNGDLQVESSPDHGTTATISIPA